jgi:serine/threonine-protein kinase
LKTASLTDSDTPLLKRLDRIIQRATAENTSDRIPSVAVLKELLGEALRSAEDPDDRMQRTLPKRIPIKRGWLYSALFVLVTVVSIGFHLLYHREKASQPVSDPMQPTTEEVKGPIQDSKGPAQMPDTSKWLPPATFQGKDGATMRFVPAGEIVFPKHFKELAGQSVKVAPLYMDSTEVTNHQYVEFLNQILPKIRVEGGVVKGGEENWLLLGEAAEGYEPIVFRNGRFYVKEPGLASHPVVRVTGHGARAYARFYGKRLPTQAEWLLALSGERQSSADPPEMDHGTSQATDADAGVGMSAMHHHIEASKPSKGEASKIALPVVHYAPNAYGLIGLETNVKEWGSQFAQREGEESPYMILPTAVRRYPWEAFADVGFRCVLSI